MADSEVEPELGVPDPVAGVVGEMLLRRRSDLVDSLGCKVVWCGSVDSLQPGKTVTAILHEVGQDGKVREVGVYLDDEDIGAMVLDSRNAQLAGTKDSDRARNSEAGKAKLEKTSRDQSRVGAGVRCTRSSFGLAGGLRRAGGHLQW